MDSVFSNKHLFVGIDVHKKRWVVTIRTYDLALKTFSMDAVAEDLEKIFISNYPGALIHIVYDEFIFWFLGLPLFQRRGL